MAGVSDLVNILMSFFVEAGGQGVSRGGKGILLSGLRKIGWAKGGGGGGGRLRGHRIGSRGAGGGGGGGGRLGSYKSRMNADANRGRRSGSGKGKGPGGKSQPAHLHGRSSFAGAQTLSGNGTTRWVKRGGAARGYTPKPRSFIKF